MVFDRGPLRSMAPGLAKVPLPEGTGPVILELRTEADGARVFGFDVRP